MRAYDLTVTGSLTVSGSTTLTGDITYDDLTATGNIITTGANKVISGSVTSTGSLGRVDAVGNLRVANGYFSDSAGIYTDKIRRVVMTPIIVLFISMTFIMPPEIYCH
jgi:hypothetical protein